MEAINLDMDLYVNKQNQIIRKIINSDFNYQVSGNNKHLNLNMTVSFTPIEEDILTNIELRSLHRY